MRQAAPAALSGVLDQIAAEVARLPEEYTRSLLPALVSAERELKRGLEKWLRSATDGEARYTAFAYRQTLVQLQGAMAAIARLEPAMYAALTNGARGAGDLAGQHLRDIVEKGQQVFSGGVTPLPIREAAVLAHGEKLLFRQYGESAKRYSGHVADDIRRQLAIGVALNETHTQLVNRLLRLNGRLGATTANGDPGVVSARIADGLAFRSRWQAERLVRTEVNNAYNSQSAALTVEARSIDPEFKLQWDSREDSRLCPLCQSLDGQIANDKDVFPGGYSHPPAHPCCRCCVTPWHESWGGPTHNEKQLEDRPIAPPGPPVVKEAGDLDRLGNALTLPKRGWITADQQATARDEARAIVRGDSRATKWQQKSLEFDRQLDRLRSQNEFVQGDYSLRTGQIRLKQRQVEESRKFVGSIAAGRVPPDSEVSSFSTIIHETVHAHGSMSPRAYEAEGKALEEAMTEIASRAIVRKRFPLAAESSAVQMPAFDWKMPRFASQADALAALHAGQLRAYDELITPLRAKLMEVMGYDLKAANEALERAAFAIRENPEPIGTPSHYRARFLDALGIEGTPRARLSSAMAGGALWPKLR